MTDYNIDIEVIWDIQGDPAGFIVTTPKTQYTYTVEELEGTNLGDLIASETITVYSQKEEFPRKQKPIDW